MNIVIEVPLAGIGIAAAALGICMAFATCWRSSDHRSNVDRVCTAYERLARMGKRTDGLPLGLEAVKSADPPADVPGPVAPRPLRGGWRERRALQRAKRDLDIS